MVVKRGCTLKAAAAAFKVNVRTAATRAAARRSRGRMGLKNWCNSGWAGAILRVSKAWNMKCGRSHDDKAYQ
jgi:hypothetical protein